MHAYCSLRFSYALTGYISFLQNSSFILKQVKEKVHKKRIFKEEIIKESSLGWYCKWGQLRRIDAPAAFSPILWRYSGKRFLNNYIQKF